MPETITRFHFHYVGRPKDPYFATRWDVKNEAEIISDTADNAIVELKRILGEPGSGRMWAIKLTKVVQEPVAVPSQSEVCQ